VNVWGRGDFRGEPGVWETVGGTRDPEKRSLGAGT